MLPLNVLYKEMKKGRIELVKETKPYTEARLLLAGKQSSGLNEYIVHWPAEMA